MIKFILTLYSLFIISCNSSESKHIIPEPTKSSIPVDISSIDSLEPYSFPYLLNDNKNECILPRELMEVSGLSYFKENKVLAVNDEQGILFVYDAQQCELTRKLKFGFLGDYEGVEFVDSNHVFILKSNGDIYHRKLDQEDFKETYKTELSLTNNLEGLGYDSENNSLLLACKGSPNLGKHSKLRKIKAIYSFDITSKELQSIPILEISDDMLLSFDDKNEEQDLSKKKIKQRKNHLKSFSPSAIAVHPIDNNYYILSSVGKLLIVIHPNGQIRNIQYLDKNKFPQPEGICFSPDGTMSISNEGKKGRGKIVQFEYLQLNK